MSCDKSNQVHLYHDGELPAGEREALEAHLRSCDECSALLGELRSLSRLFAAAPMARIEPDAMQRLREARYVLPDTGVLKIAGWLTAAAAAVLIAALPMLRREDRNPPVVQAVASADTLDYVAVTPPTDAENSRNDLVALAQWMSDDLSVNERH
jgi:anti-sigma factor RsiW